MKILQFLRFDGNGRQRLSPCHYRGESLGGLYRTHANADLPELVAGPPARTGVT